MNRQGSLILAGELDLVRPRCPPTPSAGTPNETKRSPSFVASLRTSHGLPFTNADRHGGAVPCEGANPISSSQGQRLSGMGPSFMGNTTSLPVAGKGGW